MDNLPKFTKEQAEELYEHTYNILQKENVKQKIEDYSDDIIERLNEYLMTEGEHPNWHPGLIEIINDFCQESYDDEMPLEDAIALVRACELAVSTLSQLIVYDFKIVIDAGLLDDDNFNEEGEDD